mmetsp:Transcript_12242/g.17955  ORF Transcript_12242/g.17955 Transcript_12242/m.17955 type:complete len:214 (+) Transcript_12242:3362-4003(+)
MKRDHHKASRRHTERVEPLQHYIGPVDDCSCKNHEWEDQVNLHENDPCSVQLRAAIYGQQRRQEYRFATASKVVEFSRMEAQDLPFLLLRVLKTARDSRQNLWLFQVLVELIFDLTHQKNQKLKTSYLHLVIQVLNLTFAVAHQSHRRLKETFGRFFSLDFSLSSLERHQIHQRWKKTFDHCYYLVLEYCSQDRHQNHQILKKTFGHCSPLAS